MLHVFVVVVSACAVVVCGDVCGVAIAVTVAVVVVVIIVIVTVVVMLVGEHFQCFLQFRVTILSIWLDRCCRFMVCGVVWSVLFLLFVLVCCMRCV